MELICKHLRDLAQHYRHRLAKLRGADNVEIGANPAGVRPSHNAQARDAPGGASGSHKLRNEGRINDEVLRKVEHELDLDEKRLSLMQ